MEWNLHRSLAKRSIEVVDYLFSPNGHINLKNPANERRGSRTRIEMRCEYEESWVDDLGNISEITKVF
jgi:hypothetical protein